MQEALDNSNGVAGWSQVWHLPALVLGALLFGLGLYLAQPEGPADHFDASLDAVARYIEARNFEPAEGLINDLEDHLGRATLTQQGRLRLLHGDLKFLRGREQGRETPEGLRAVIQLYTEAEKEFGAKLRVPRLRRIAESYVALGEDGRAMEVLDRIREEFKDHDAADRYLVLRHIIERRLGKPRGEREAVGGMLERFFEELRDEKDPLKRREQMVWGVKTRAGQMLESGDVSRASDYLVKELIQFRARGGEDDLAPLEVLLGKAY